MILYSIVSSESSPLHFEQSYSYFGGIPNMSLVWPPKVEAVLRERLVAILNSNLKLYYEYLTLILLFLWEQVTPMPCLILEQRRVPSL